MLKICPNCKEEFETEIKNKKYHTIECGKRFLSMKYHEKNKEIRKKKMSEYYYKNKGRKRTLLHKKCPYCYTEFDTYRTDKIYCNPKCRNSHGNEKYIMINRFNNTKSYQKILKINREYKRKRRKEIKENNYEDCVVCFSPNDNVLFNQQVCTNCKELYWR